MLTLTLLAGHWVETVTQQSFAYFLNLQNCDAAVLYFMHILGEKYFRREIMQKMYFFLVVLSTLRFLSDVLGQRETAGCINSVTRHIVTLSTLSTDYTFCLWYLP